MYRVCRPLQTEQRLRSSDKKQCGQVRLASPNVRLPPALLQTPAAGLASARFGACGKRTRSRRSDTKRHTRMRCRRRLGTLCHRIMLIKTKTPTQGFLRRRLSWRRVLLRLYEVQQRRAVRVIQRQPVAAERVRGRFEQIVDEQLFCRHFFFRPRAARERAVGK